jgi:type I restriction enzyme S subunit
VTAGVSEVAAGNSEDAAASKWTVEPIRELCLAIIDCVNKTAPTVSGPTPYKMIRTTNVRHGRIHMDGVRYVEEDVYRRWVRRGTPIDGDIVLTREAPLGEVGMLRDPQGVFLGQRLVMYRANPDRVDQHFLLYAMRAPGVQAQIRAFGSGATVEHMRVPDCGELLVEYPCLSEQRRVGSVLAAFDQLIEINERRMWLLENLARSLYREWFVRFRFPGHTNEFVDSEVGRIPKGWTVVPLGEVATLRYGKALPARQRLPGPYPVVSSAGVIDEHAETLVSGPGIVVGRKGNVGTVWWVGEPFFPIDTTYYVESGVPLGLIYWQLQHLNFIDSHAAVPGLSREQAAALLVLKVDRQLAERFDGFHQTAFALIGELQTQNRALVETRDLLLPRLVTGILEIADVDLGDLLAPEGE